jgi:hypothetical protein
VMIKYCFMLGMNIDTLYVKWMTCVNVRPKISQHIWSLLEPHGREVSDGAGVMMLDTKKL